MSMFDELAEAVERASYTPDVVHAIHGVLAQHRDDIARSLALVDGLVNPPLSGRYGRYADAVLAYLQSE